MYFYFKDNLNGVGITSNKETFVGEVTWITKEEYDELVIENEKLLHEIISHQKEEVTE